MIFDALFESAKRGELLLVEGGLCHWHLRQDGQLTIREIIATPPGRGTGSRMLSTPRSVPGATRIVAKCPAELDANRWYLARGFELSAVEHARSGAPLNVWTLPL